LDAVVQAGASAVVFEMVDADLSAELTRECPIPVIGIGSGDGCDGQVLVMHDLLGIYADPPPFERRPKGIRRGRS
jgi:3-methyl-2-oxobutanoate hydroxymethyltransferase